MNPSMSNQQPATAGDSLIVLIDAVERHSRENDFDPEPLLDLVTQQQEHIWDLCELLRTMPLRLRDDRLDKLHDGLAILRELWRESEGGAQFVFAGPNSGLRAHSPCARRSFSSGKCGSDRLLQPLRIWPRRCCQCMPTDC